MNTDSAILDQALAFHGHKCWASTAGVRLGLAAMEALGVSRSAQAAPRDHRDRRPSRRHVLR